VRQTSTLGLLRPLFTGSSFDLSAARQAHARVIGLLETQLSKSKYLVGEIPTIADLFVLPEIDQLSLGIFNYSSYPNITRWLHDAQNDIPAYKQNFESVKPILSTLQPTD
jgi:glutathione S-transferase